MGLSGGYGVVIGEKHAYYRDSPDNFGRYYHGNLEIATPRGVYKCAIDVDPKALPDGIQWRIVKIRQSDFKPLLLLADGWHQLQSAAGTGALDYLRSTVLHPPTAIQQVSYGGWVSCLINWLQWNPPWNNGTGIQALEGLESVIENATRLFVFGEPFSRGLGVHNIHQNQGDPVGSVFAGENGIWQDGATVVQSASGNIVGFLNKFKTQSLVTDRNGRPV